METIVVRDRRIRSGDMIAAVGVFGGEGVKPVCKYLHSGSADELRLDVTFQGVPVSVQIDGEQAALRHTGTVPVRRGVQQADELRLARQYPGDGESIGERRGALRYGHYLSGAYPACMISSAAYGSGVGSARLQNDLCM